ncbi:MAG: glycosyltransferase family 2 protein [Deltaproteobacteria bacterium]|nr:glycosyltransferase family 2 protein [Deltaproteobacteria bacterium]
MRQPAVVIVNYNTRQHLQESLASAAREGAAEVVVVDNASSDGSAQMVRAEYPWVTLHANPTNRGYGAAANRGIANCTAAYVVLLNADARLGPGALTALRACLDDRPETAAVGPRLLNVDGSLQPSCYAFPGSLRWILDNDVLFHLNRRLPLVRRKLLRTWAHDRERVVPWIKGAAMAIRREAFDAVGGFDESFPLFYEETDLCYRLHAAGWRILFSPAATVHHLGGASTGDQVAEVSLRLFAGQVQYFQAHCPRVNGVWTELLKALQLPPQIRDWARLQLTRDASTREMLARRLADRRRKLHLDPHRAREAWWTARHLETPSRVPHR